MKPMTDDDDDGEDEIPANVNIPSGGYSVQDDMAYKMENEVFDVEFEPYKDRPGVARILTSSSTDTGGVTGYGYDDPVRYVVALSPPPPVQQDDEKKANMDESNDESVSNSEARQYAMIDVPPYSETLVKDIRKFIGPNSSIVAILITNRDSLHFDRAPGAYVRPKSDLTKWVLEFPGVEVVMYRLDIPRDCQGVVTQKIDGYGPWGLEETDGQVKFVETGRPLTMDEWDEETREKILEKGQEIPDEEEENDDDDQYERAAIRQREEGKRILALHTPGRTYGSVTYIFPEMKLCCSGFAIPIEDTRPDANVGVGRTGPMLDYRGYITSKSGGVGTDRWLEMVRIVVDEYADRFTGVLPARGDPVFFDDDSTEKERANILSDVLAQYEKIGSIYERLGIM
eukprot:9529213-Ditylum_brightwellii.AAC.1